MVHENVKETFNLFRSRETLTTSRDARRAGGCGAVGIRGRPAGAAMSSTRVVAG